MSLDQINKQAKRLHKVLPELLKQQKEFNLAFSQELVARQYGYPSYHAAATKQSDSYALAHREDVLKRSFDESLLRSLCKKPLKVLDRFPMAADDDRLYYHGGIGFFDVARNRHFDVYLLWVGARRGVDEYTLLLSSVSGLDTTLFDTGAFYNNDQFRVHFLERLKNESGMKEVFRTHKIKSLCCIFPNSPNRDSVSLHVFPVDFIDDFWKAVHWEVEDIKNPWLGQASLDLARSVKTDEQISIRSQHLLICLHWALDVRCESTIPKASEPVGFTSNPYLKLEGFRFLMQSSMQAVEAKSLYLDLGIKLDIPGYSTSPAARLLESYSKAIPELLPLVPVSRDPGKRALSSRFAGLKSHKALSGLKGLLPRLVNRPMNFGVNPKILCFSDSFYFAGKLIEDFIESSLSSGQQVVYLSRSTPTIAKHLVDQVVVVDLGLLENSPETVNRKLEKVFFSNMHRLDQSFVIEDCDLLARHPAFKSVINHIFATNRPCLLQAQSTPTYDANELFSVVGMRQNFTLFSMNDGNRSVFHFNETLQQQNQLKASSLRESYARHEALVYQSGGEKQENGQWFEVQAS